jgi:SWI/SNF-related matrix-associated actin-dependent regulator 1 of chromatin subfamily A
MEKPKLQLYKYQVKGVVHIERCIGNRALIADDMGLGKTIQALAWTRVHKTLSPILVVVPNSVKINWMREAEKWLRKGYLIQCLNGQKPHIIDGTFVIINYDILHYWLDELLLTGFEAMIVDEGHYTKNPQSKRSKAFVKLARNIKKVIVLTGTPIENKPIDIFTVLNALRPDIFPSRFKFAQYYCGAKRTRFGWDMSGSTHAKELHELLTSTVMIRRKKSEVLKQLPPKQIHTIPFELSNVAEYRKAENEFIEYLSARFDETIKNIEEQLKKEIEAFQASTEIKIEAHLSKEEIDRLKQRKINSALAAPTLVKIEILKQVAIKGKMKEIKQWIHDILDSGEKLIVFAIHRTIIDELMKEFESVAVKIDGSVKGTKRQQAVDAFQTNPKVRLFIGNIKAAGIGLTLTAASNVAFIQFPWNPGELTQAEDRAHRITQTKKVFIWRLVGAGTIEEEILKLLEKKQKIIDSIIDGKAVNEQTMISEIINIYRKKPIIK